MAAAETLIGLGAHLVALVVPSNRTGADVARAGNMAQQRGLTQLTQPESSDIGSFADRLQALAPDLAVIWSYSMILPPELIPLPPLGCVNVHGGLLPEYRGGHVMQWAIINGECETGVTLHYLDEGIDTGPLIAQSRFPIEIHDDGVSVQRKLQLSGTALLQEWWPRIAQGTAPRLSQDESRAHYHRLLTPKDGLIDWNAGSMAIHNLVRALVSPRPGAFTFLQEQKLVIRRAMLTSEVSGTASPGTIVELSQHGACVATGDGALSITEVESDGVVIEPSGFTAVGIIPGGLLTGSPGVLRWTR